MGFDFFECFHEEDSVSATYCVLFCPLDSDFSYGSGLDSYVARHAVNIVATDSVVYDFVSDFAHHPSHPQFLLQPLAISISLLFVRSQHAAHLGPIQRPSQ